MNKRVCALVIMDGWGISPCAHAQYSAIAHAHKPCYETLRCNYPYYTLHAHGIYVGLPQNTVGNSEVGHMTIGCGARIEQPLPLMNTLCERGLDTHPAIRTLLAKSCAPHHLHIVHLLSDGCVHSSMEHLHAMLITCSAHGISPRIHAILDGRDTPAHSAATYLKQLEAWLKLYGGSLASLSGRWYAMDRDEHWDRTYAAYCMLSGNTTASSESWQDILERHYSSGQTEETLPPTLLKDEYAIHTDDTILSLLIREDRARQLIALLMHKEYIPLRTHSNPPHNLCPASIRRPVIDSMVTAIPYHPAFDIPSLVHIQPPKTSIIDDCAELGYRVYTIAETEKYAHVTYFFNGGREDVHASETRVMIPSIPVVSYADTPRMSADAITAHVYSSLRDSLHDMYLINYANADMVGHTGSFDATVQAVQCVDEQLRTLHDEIVMKRDGILIITADHGNAEAMIDPLTGAPNPAHTTNAVPCIIAAHETRHEQGTATLSELADIRPLLRTILSNGRCS